MSGAIYFKYTRDWSLFMPEAYILKYSIYIKVYKGLVIIYDWASISKYTREQSLFMTGAFILKYTREWPLLMTEALD